MVNRGTPPEQAAERKITIEYLETQLEEMEKEAKKVTNATTQFWGSVFQDG